MEELNEPRRDLSRARERRTLLLASAVFFFLAAPLLTLAFKLKHRHVVVPDEDPAIKPISQISGNMGRYTPRIVVEHAKPAPEPEKKTILASLISFARAPEPPPVPEVRAAPPPAKPFVRRTAKPKKKTIPAKKLPVAKKIEPVLVPPMLARPSGFYEFDFIPDPPAAAPVKSEIKLRQALAEPVAVPDAVETRQDKPAKKNKSSAIIVERVPSN